MKGLQSIQKYFERQQTFAPHIHTMPGSDLGMVVVIPCFAEHELSKSLQSLARCTPPPCAVEVLVVVNYPQCANSEEIALCQYNLLEVQRMAMRSKASFAFYEINKFAMPCEHSGVGVARKYGMDEAAHRLMKAGNPRGIIACFDADSTCQDNYMETLCGFFASNKQVDACSIYYEHPIDGIDYPAHLYEGIARYELHLRYYNQALRYAGLPYAYHTVGSSMACTAAAYARVGGMVKNQAGEDFYFMQKFIEQGKVAELNHTCVYPSPRISHRVPFGTGRTMLKMQESGNYHFHTYSIEAFEQLKDAAAAMQRLYKAGAQEIHDCYQAFGPRLRTHIHLDEFANAVTLASSNAASQEMFERRVFNWFNAFRCMRFLNDAHEKSTFAKHSVESQAAKLLGKHGVKAKRRNAKELLQLYRQLERQGLQAMV